ncbi:hypothetical protein ACUN24_09140 [Pedobacter sp. WC2501]|uniref:hypothetical protein n=1 Tax=Pedobacter sp. WC2501 TaxID=3461400 RepID=UPI004045A3F7
MFLKALKNTFKIGWFKTSIASTIGGIFSYFTFLKSLGASVPISIAFGFSTIIVILIIKFSYHLGEENKQEETVVILEEKTKELGKDKTELTNSLFNLRKHFTKSMETLNECFNSINYLRNMKFASLIKDDQENPIEAELSEEEPVNEFMDVLGELCDHLKLIFDEKTGKIYSVSVKLPVIVKQQLNADSRVMNVCRDRHSALSRSNDVYKSTVHTISGNTCFNNIFQSVLNGENIVHYINNDITKSSDYKTTSIRSYANNVLPYKSELVLAIKPQASEDSEILRVLGFLCIDCNDVNGFEEDIDVVMINGVAEGIFDVVEHYSTLINSANHIVPQRQKKTGKLPRRTQLNRKK